MPENTSWKADVLNAELQATACPGAIDALIDNAILLQRNLTAVDGRKAIGEGRQACEGMDRNMKTRIKLDWVGNTSRTLYFKVQAKPRLWYWYWRTIGRGLTFEQAIELKKKLDALKEELL